MFLSLQSQTSDISAISRQGFPALLLFLFTTLLFSGQAAANDNYRDCVLTRSLDESSNTSSEEIRKQCSEAAFKFSEQERELGAISRRILEERKTQWNRFVITPHRSNYILPYTHSNKVNRDAYAFVGDRVKEANHYEAKFQVSIKVPLNSSDLLLPNDALFFGYTMQSWWQVYAAEISSPFRETNYQPEFFYLFPINWQPVKANTGIALGIEHQSNGQSQILSRSWNRIYAQLLMEKYNAALSMRAWYRLRENEKSDVNDPNGDDNPDIEAYFGHFEIAGAYTHNDYEVSLMVRNNLRSDNHGALELTYSVPLFGHLKGLLYYFNGYGESLIDYNHHQERVGLGIALTDHL